VLSTAAHAPPCSGGKCVCVLQCKLIVCQMSNTRCQALSWLLLPMTPVVLLAVTGLVANELLLLYLWTAAVILAHIHYGVSVVRADAQRTHLYSGMTPLSTNTTLAPPLHRPANSSSQSEVTFRNICWLPGRSHQPM